MAKKKISARTVYNRFFDKFKRKDGYIGSLLKNRTQQDVFQFQFDSISDVKEAKEYLSKNGVNYRTSSVDKKKVMVFP